MTVDTWVNICALILGLFGVFITLLYNARLARKQQDRQWEYEQKKAQTQDAHERAVLRSALIAELQQIRESIQTDIGQAEKVKKNEEQVICLIDSPEPNTEIYQAVLPRIGMLSEAEISYIVQAYKGLAIQTQKIKLISRREGGGQIYIQRDHIELYMGIMTPVLKEIDDALNSLSYHQD